MLIYRARLRPRSATRSPWQADTLFGHLCWLTLYEEGEAALESFLEEYRAGRPPLLFSNGFPGAWLPRPLLPARNPGAERSLAEQEAALKQIKETKGIRWVSLEEFNRLRRGEEVTLKPRPTFSGDRTILKNQINRLTFGTTAMDEGLGGSGLFNATELAFVETPGVERVGLDVSVYVKARDEAWAGRGEALLRRLSRSGYGAKKSAGYGHFELAAWERFTAWDEPLPEANGFISLSNWVPAAGDPRDGFYSRLVKYGKLGEELATTENPFKFPLIMFTAGSSFYTGGLGADWYGRLVAGVAPGSAQVVQYGYAFTVPAHLNAGNEPDR